MNSRIIGGGSLSGLGSALFVLVGVTLLQGCDESGSIITGDATADARVCVKTGEIDGKACTGTCMNNNTKYDTLAEAERKCEELVECTMILEWTDGKFFLRRDRDSARGGYPGKTHTYNCTGVAAESSQQEDGKAAEEGATETASEDSEEAASEGASPAPDPTERKIGGAQDEHGCMTAAGYSWCAPMEMCIPPGKECEAPSDEEDGEAGGAQDGASSTQGTCDLYDVVQSNVQLPFSLTAQMSAECCDTFHEVARLERENKIKHSADTGAKMKALYERICEDLQCPDMVQEDGLKEVLQLACTWGEAGEAVEPALLALHAVHKPRGRALRRAHRVQ